MFESRDEISKAKGNMDGAVYVQNIVNGEFQKNYRKKYGNDEQIGYAANAYEFAEMVHSLFKDTTTISADDVLKKIKTYSRNDLDALDKIKFEYENGDNSFEFPLGLKRINGNLITVERYYW